MKGKTSNLLDKELQGEEKLLQELNKVIEENNKLKYKLREHIFYFIFASIIYIDAVLFIYLVDGVAALAIVILQLVLLLILGDKFDIKSLELLLKRITGMFHSKD